MLTRIGVLVLFAIASLINCTLGDFLDTFFLSLIALLFFVAKCKFFFGILFCIILEFLAFIFYHNPFQSLFL